MMVRLAKSYPGGKRVPEEGTHERETPFTISF